MAHRVGFGTPDLFRVNRGVDVAHEVEDCRQPGGRVQVIEQRVAERRAGLVDRRLHGRRVPVARHGLEPREAIDDAAQRLLGLLHPRPCEVELLPVVRRQQQVAKRRRAMAACDDVRQGVDVAERLRHLLVLDEEMLHVHPEPREGRARGALALRDLVLVVGKDQVDAAGMNVDRRLPEQAQRHGGALEVPPRPARPRAHFPRRLARPGRLPQHEIARILLCILVDVDAHARLHPLGIEARELAVAGQRRDLEIGRTVARVGVAMASERLDQLAHRAQVGFIGGARRLFGRLDAQLLAVLAKRLDPLIGVLAERHRRALRAGNRLVVDVGVIDRLAHRVAAQVFERAAQHVDTDVSAEVADVGARVDGRPARVHADDAVARRRERLFLACQRVVETQHVYVAGAKGPALH